MRIKLITGLFIFVIVFSIGVKNSSYSLQEMSVRPKTIENQGKVLGVSDNSKTVIVPAKEIEIIWPKKPVKVASSSDFDIEAASGLVMDCATGDVIFEKNADNVAPIASLTKLMTAMVFLEHNPGWDTTYEIKDRDIRGGGISYLHSSDIVSLNDLFHLALVASENTAAMSLSRATGLSDSEFAKAMNEKAKELGLVKTKYIEPVGLDNGNVSTARELAVIVKQALDNEFISKATALKKYSFVTKSGQKRTAQATNKLLGKVTGNNIKIEGGKTGHTDSSGYCFSGKFKNDQGREVVSVVLGSETADARFSLTESMIGWVYKNFSWK